MKGIDLEIEVSKLLHNQYIAILVSSKLLRARRLGQLDIVVLDKNTIVVYEIKSSEIGIQAVYKSKQITRLRSSTYFLSMIFELKSKLNFIAKR